MHLQRIWTIPAVQTSRVDTTTTMGSMEDNGRLTSGKYEISLRSRDDDEEHDHYDSSSVTQKAQETKVPAVDSNIGVSTFRIDESIMDEAKAKIEEAEAHRRESKLPKRVIPMVEMLLPKDRSLRDFEDGMERKVGNLRQLWKTCVGPCTSGTADARVKDETRRNSSRRSDHNTTAADD